jgi:hypothetical protein
LDPRISNWWLAVDPGLQGTGWALWKGKTLQDAGIINAPRKGTTAERAWAIASKIGKLARSNRCEVMAVEWPAFHGGTAGGEMVARRGDLVKLSFLVGVLCGAAQPVPFLQVEIHAWKGQLPKEVVADRVVDRLGAGTVVVLGLKDHMYDAVGIGLYLLGRL